MKYYRFGSKDSLDEDYLIDHPNATGKEDDTQLIKELKDVFPEMQNWDMNIIKIVNGKILYSIPSKGNPDAVHNSLLFTYSLHNQCFICPISVSVERDVSKAINKCIDHILTFHKKTDKNFYCKFARKALKSNSLDEKLKVMKIIDFNLLKLSEDAEIKINSLKKIAFHIGQTISLIKNIEIYTKSDLIKEHPDLSDYINRKPLNSNEKLNAKIFQLLQAVTKYNDFQLSLDMKSQ